MDNMRENVKRIFQYMKAIKNINNNTINNIDDYGKIKGEQKYFFGNIPMIDNGFNINCNEDREEWIEVFKQEIQGLDSPNNKILENKFKIQELYNRLFNLYQFLNLNGEEYELIYSDSLLVWNYKDTVIKHPLLSNTMELRFQPEINKFSLVALDTISNFEVEIFEKLNLDSYNKLLEIKESIKENFEEYRSIKVATKRIKEILTNLDEKYEIKTIDVDIKNVKITDIPTVLKSPMLILRKKSEKSSLEDIDTIIKRIDEGKYIPESIQALVLNNEELNKNRQSFVWKNINKEILFPLPANCDQIEIAKRLSENYGVVVEGPPGTGKSHTIVNLICHLLAQGKRVLVTSQREKALTVLRDKIPEEIRYLCISDLGSNKEELDELEKSIRVITDNISLDKETLKKEISSLEIALNKSKEKQKLILDKLKNIEVYSNEKLKDDSEEVTVLEGSKWLKEKEQKYYFLKDIVDYRKRKPMNNQEYNQFITLINTVSSEEMEDSSQITQLIGTFPKLHKLVKLTKDLEKMKKGQDVLKCEIKKYNIDNDFIDNINKIEGELVRLKDTLNTIETCQLNELLEKYYSDTYVKDITDDFLKKASISLEEIGNIIKELALKNIEIPKNIDFKQFKDDYKRVSNELDKNGKLGFVFKLTNKNSMYIMESCSVNNKGVDNTDTKFVIENYIKKMELEEQFLQQWNQYATSFNISKFNEINIENLSAINKYIKGIKEITLVEEKNISNVRKLVKEEFFKGINIFSIKEIEEFQGVFPILEKLELIRKVEKELDEYKVIFAKNKITSKVAKSIEQFKYDEIYDQYREFDRLIKLNKDVKKVNELVKSLKEIMPLFYDELRRKNRIYMDINFEEAFKYLTWKNRLDKIRLINSQNLDEELRVQRNNENYIVLNLVNKKTWYNQIDYINDNTKRSLYAWLEAMKKIGKGTGKYANYYKKLAKEEMQNCKKAIPVWIMPFNKVIENIPLTEELFDVIIFDESSQSSVMAIQALFRGKKACIVGDDNQISPMVLGNNKEEQLKLIKENLDGIPNKEWFEIETSLYNTALRIFPNKLLLREHFRSVPEIIEFSNNYSYSGQIIPLRYPKSDERFDNPIIPYKVSGGYRTNDTNKKVNVPEATAIAEKIVQCCKDSRYNNMTFGIISLLGNDQSELIEKFLKEKLGESEMIKRKIICGDAYSFQGDERDIMFLSMVIAKNTRFAALTKEEDKRRFNVAASRARNQMWLFHSIDLEELNPNCARHALLSYCLNPIKEPATIFKKTFTSSLQKDLFNTLVKGNYEVNTQVKVGRFIIDLVVEGNGNRLGVICHGDNYDPMNSWNNERIYREQLERVGWEFIVVNGWEFYREPKKVLKRILVKLSEMKIQKINEKSTKDDLIKERRNSLIYKIKEKDIYLTEKQQVVSKYIVENIDELKEIPSLGQLSKIIEVSPSTIKTTLNKLNLGSFKTFVNELKEEIL